MKDESMVEVLARALCEDNGYDPDALEPGSDPYRNNKPCVDGRNSKGEACHFLWRKWDSAARACLQALLDHGPTKEMIAAGASDLTGEIAATCCHKTGGQGRADGQYCACREGAQSAFRAMISKALGK